MTDDSVSYFRVQRRGQLVLAEVPGSPNVLQCDDEGYAAGLWQLCKLCTEIEQETSLFEYVLLI